MQVEESVTRWIDQLRAGEPQAAQLIWERYVGRLVGLARQRLRGVSRAAADEEDVALSAFASFCRAAEAGRFPHLCDRYELGGSSLQALAILKLEGYGNEEIGGWLGCSLRTVERKLALIRSLWEGEVCP